jgi:S1-C subfamily serine protease
MRSVRCVRVAATLLAVATLVVGCAGLRDALNRKSSTSPTPVASSEGVIAEARPGVVRVHGESETCMKVTEGSGFVVAPHKVMTNAHVVAGAETFSVDSERKTHAAQVVSYDPQADIAILDVPDLAAGPLKFAEYTAGSGVDVLVLGYPGGTSFHASPATVREVAEIKGPDIYRVATVKREVYVLNGSFPDTGSSGSAVIDLSGRVLGVYFGAETSNKTTGFAMTAAQVAPQMARVNVAQAADTQGCIY